MSTALRLRYQQQPRGPDLFTHSNVRAPHHWTFNPQKLTKVAAGLWRISMDARQAKLTERWLAACGLTLPEEVEVKFHERLSFGEQKAPGLLWPITDLKDNALVGVLRYFLSDSGEVLAKRVLGRSFKAVVRLSPDADVTMGVLIAPSVERGLLALASGVQPIWVADALPELKGVEVTAIDKQNESLWPRE